MAPAKTLTCELHAAAARAGWGAAFSTSIAAAIPTTMTQPKPGFSEVVIALGTNQVSTDSSSITSRAGRSCQPEGKAAWPSINSLDLHTKRYVRS
jgi:hypothetical protein